MSSTPEEREAKSRSAAIDRQLRHDARDYENTVKILLLGEGDGGAGKVGGGWMSGSGLFQGGESEFEQVFGAQGER